MPRTTPNGDANTITSCSAVSEHGLGHTATSRARTLVIQSIAPIGVKKVPK